ncbi:MAG: hypothetical protein SOT71_08020 [Romboutsia timonensis]|uniref:hypothetical protein n=1 Tax=Romboutsia timonensis TaxID=1776391 RepID=UPI002A74C338|nr:hypothetical protein [Romboutsia timonensis]MDY2882584.1 hypothetical protein [Romboutsia timonensis]
MINNNSTINQGKTIADLQPLNEIDGSSFFAVHLAGQTYKMTYNQLINKLKSDFNFGYYDDIGTIYFSERLDQPLGCLNYCNGGEYTAIDIQYPDFYTKLVNKHIHWITYDEYERIIQETKTENGANGGGWCPFLAFDDANKRMRMPKLSGDLVYLAFGVNRKRYADGLPNILAEFSGGGANSAINSGAVIKKSMNSGTYNNFGTAFFQNYQINASFSNPIFGKSNAVQPKTNQVNAYIVASNTRFIQSDSSASTVALNKEIVDRQQADIDLDERINGLVSLINGANSAYYKNTYLELVEWVANNKMILKVGNLLLCGGVTAGEDIREFIWSGEQMVEKERTINIAGYVKTETFNQAMALKVNKIDGWGLSENNFSTLEKTKLEQAILKTDLDTVVSSLEEEINMKADKQNIIQEIVDNRNSVDFIPSEQAVSNILNKKLSKKMDKVDSFIEASNINLLKVGNDITGQALDLSSFSSIDVKGDYEIKFVPTSVIINNQQMNLNQRLKYIKANNSLVYFEQVGTNLEKSVYLVKNNIIVAPNLLGGKYWNIKSSQIGDASTKLIVSEIPFQLEYTLTEIKQEVAAPEIQPDFTFGTFELFDTAFHQSFTDAENYNNKTIKIEENNFTYELTKQLKEELPPEGVFASFDSRDEFNEYFNSLSLNEKRGLNYKYISVKILDQDMIDIEFQPYNNINQTPADYTCANDEEFRDLVNNVLKPTLTLENDGSEYLFYIEDTSSYLMGTVIIKPTYYLITLSPISGYYLCIATSIPKPSCILGVYSEITAKDIMTRLQALETSGVEGQTRDFKSLEKDIWEITDVQIVNGGSGYIVGDRIKVLFNNITGNDIRGELKVNEINQDTGAVTSLIITHKGYYLQDVSNSELETRNRDNPNGDNLVVSITTQSRKGLSLDSYVPTEYNTYSTVMLDETHSYLTTQYIWQENAEHTGGEWVFLKESEEECRDLQIDNVVLGAETSGTLPQTQGGFGQDVSNALMPTDREKFLGIDTNGNIKKMSFDLNLNNVKNFDLIQYQDNAFVNTNTIKNLTMLGINTEANEENKLAVKSSSVLFDTTENDMKYKINKSNVTATASYIFQDNYSGRAEFGLVGEDNFSLRVSPDGSVWKQSFVVDYTTGDIDFKNKVTINGKNVAAEPFKVVDTLPENPEENKMYFVRFNK